MERVFGVVLSNARDFGQKKSKERKNNLVTTCSSFSTPLSPIKCMGSNVVLSFRSLHLWDKQKTDRSYSLS